MRICVIGKFPPIQGGVSMRTYWNAHALAMRGHDVHVVTNAKEVRPPYRMHMRKQDWQRCEGTYGDGSVTVHWTDPVDRAQTYIPMASPFVSKLAAVAASLHSRHPFDVISSHYMEPYGIAGHLAAQMTGVPHVTRMAGSDAGRLWHHPQLEALYDHVLRSADVLIAVGPVAERARERGVAPDRIVPGGGYVIPEHLFTPAGRKLDVAKLRREVAPDPELREVLWGGFKGGAPYFGVYGKLGESKGSFALLAAMHRLKRAGLKVGLVALAHGPDAVEKGFRDRARKLGLADRIVQVPFLPHWRVPEFLRGCLAVCCLEQGFPIGFHTPIIPLEVLLCGGCLIASTEVIRKLPAYGRLVHGYGCVAIEDVNDIDALSSRLAAIVGDPKPAAVVGRRGREFAREVQRDVRFPDALERILAAAAARQPVPALPTTSDPSEIPADAEPIETGIAAAEREAYAEREPDPLFRLHIGQWAMANGALAGLIPARHPRLRLIAHDGDASHIVAFGQSERGQRAPLLVDGVTAQILNLCDGKRTAGQVAEAIQGGPGRSQKANNLKWIEHLFVHGLIALHEPGAAASVS